MPAVFQTWRSYFILFLSLFLLFQKGQLKAQTDSETDNVPKEEIQAVETIALKDISVETEKLDQRIRYLSTILQQTLNRNEIDSVLNLIYTDANYHKDSLIENLNNYSQRSLRELMVEWKSYQSQLKKHQNSVNERLEDINGLSDEVVHEITRWKNTKESLASNTASEELFANIDTVVFTLEDLLSLSMVKLDSIFVIQKRLTSVAIIINDVIAEINKREFQLQKEYFVFDSPPIWRSGKAQKDTVAAETAKINDFQILSTGLKDDMSHLRKFVASNYQTFLLQLIFCLLLLILLIAVKRKKKKSRNKLNTPLERKANVIINNPISATLTMGVLISAFFHEGLIPIYAIILILIILSATAYLLPRLTHKKIKTPLLLLIAITFIEYLYDDLEPASLSARSFVLINSLMLAFVLIYGRKIISSSPQMFPKISIFNKYILPFFILFTVSAFIANIIGMVRLSRFLISATVTSVGLGAVVYLTVQISTSIIILLFKFRNHISLATISNFANVVQKRISPILSLAGIIVWGIFTLSGFEVYEYLQIWIGNILELEAKVGEMQFSIGDILSFIFIFTCTLFISHFVARVFQDEWLIKYLPRGIAPAISLLARIFIISIGFYMSLSAAGFDLSKIGLLVGALGVGIGFGLQNIVLNFISGLILAFERPINLGDAIEVDNEMGVVTSIGVRASKIKTYDGSEIIIPNGDLVSKKVENWTLGNRDRRSKITIITSSLAEPEEVIAVFNSMASEHPRVFTNPAPKTFFHGFNQDGNLHFSLIYWTSFSDTLDADSDIALSIHKALKSMNIQAPVPVHKIISE
ncbi:mechanosensitive ion channel domain-containing protein [Carboxylicivirga sp. RSCT41]|uniref:mechanosensitive ion channel domain-containing protein n=1 Tax=Carboxylicivirga agarovorans TaxID=3417570 RepID=UPI003D338710